MSIYETSIIANSFAHLRLLGKLDLDLKYRGTRQISRNKFMVSGILNEEEITQVKQAGFEVTIVSDLASMTLACKAEVSPENRFLTAKHVSDMAKRTIQGYLTVDEVEESLLNLSVEHPDLVELIELPNRTWEERVSHAVRIGSSRDTEKTTLLFTGSMHAREWGGSDICVSFLLGLVDSYLADESLQYGQKVFSIDQVRTIIDDVNIIVFPDVNPDGKHYSQTVFPMWRKNRNPNNDVDQRYLGVDLNRNFDFLWSSGIGTSTNPASNIYKGESPFSEPEILNILHLFKCFENIEYYVDIHSYSELILYSWGNDDNQSNNPKQHFGNSEYDGKRGRLDDDLYREFISPTDEILSIGLAHRMNQALASVHGSQGYTVNESSGLYPTTGTSSDYAFSRSLAARDKRKIQGWTIEFGKEFIPPYREMKNIIKEVGAAMTELCWCVCPR
ncbi:M14 family metallopeptidase [Desulfosediminicola flagellatus]|uniref:M14 family metallopeptidase n=1 Tax=Desulfosediminicola flagellatus TaxID=2569541 RepID=UPI0010AD22E7|nr:M14 family metallopeptidase [Desulfosediminicola flagellatus]